jgi:hypothetical protein
MEEKSEVFRVGQKTEILIELGSIKIIKKKGDSRSDILIELDGKKITTCTEMDVSLRTNENGLVIMKMLVD